MNPDKEPGRVTLITRYGAKKVRFDVSVEERLLNVWGRLTAISLVISAPSSRLDTLSFGCATLCMESTY